MIKLSLILVAMLGGCALLTATPPHVEVVNIQLRGVGLLNADLQIGLCVSNPNDNELAFQRITVDMDVAGEAFAEGRSESTIRLPPHQSVLVPFDVVATIMNAGPQLLATIVQGAVPYRVHGTVQLASLGIALPFSRSGRLDILQIGQTVLADQALAFGSRCGSV